MKAKVRGGYGTLKIAGQERKQGEVFELSEDDFKAKHWVLDPVVEKVVEPVKVVEPKKEVVPEPVKEVVAEALAAEDTMNRVMDSPLLRRGTLKKGRK